MSRARWHILREEGAVTLARHLPARFDVAATTRLAPVRMVPLAHQIRQDLWRALQRLRGFSPVVRIVAVPGGLHVIAGGRLDHAGPRAAIEARVQEVLDHAGNRTRWTRWAQ